MSKTEIISQVESKIVNLKKAELALLKLVKRIYKAFEQNNFKTTKKLQKTLTKSWSYKVLAQKNSFFPKLSYGAFNKIKASVRTKPQYMLRIKLNNSTKGNTIKNYLLKVALNNIAIPGVVITLRNEVRIFSVDKGALISGENTLKNWLKLWLQSIDIRLVNTQESRFEQKLVKSYYRRLTYWCERLKGAKQIELIKQLNLIMQKYYYDYLFWCSSKVLRSLDYLLAKKLYRWALPRHPRKGKLWIVNQYWHLALGNKWRFCVGEICLNKHINFARFQG